MNLYDGIIEHNFTRHLCDVPPERARQFPRYAKTLCGRTVHFTNLPAHPDREPANKGDRCRWCTDAWEQGR